MTCIAIEGGILCMADEIDPGWGDWFHEFSTLTFDEAFEILEQFTFAELDFVEWDKGKLYYLRVFHGMTVSVDVVPDHNCETGALTGTFDSTDGQYALKVDLELSHPTWPETLSFSRVKGARCRRLCCSPQKPTKEALLCPAP